MRQAFKRWSVKIAGGLVFVVVLLLVVAAGGLLWLSGEGGRSWVAGQVEELASSETARIDIGEIERLSASTVFVDRLTVADEQGVYLTIGELLVDYRFLSLLGGNPRIDRLMAGTVTLERLPRGPEEEETPAPREPGFRIPRIHIGQFGVQTLMLGEAVTGRAESLQVEGRIILTSDLTGSDIALRIADRNDPSAALADIEFAPMRGENRLELRAALRDEGQGPLSGITGISPLNLSLQGEGPLDAWDGHITGEAGDIFSIDSAVTLDFSGRRAKAVLSGSWGAPPVTATGETTFTYGGGTGEVQAGYRGDLGLPEFKVSGLNLTLGVEPDSALFGAAPAEGMRVRASGSWGAFKGSEGEEYPFTSETTFFVKGVLGEGGFTLADLQLKNDAASLASSGVIGFSNGRLDLESALTVDALSQFHEPLRGNGRATLTLSGTYQPLALTGNVRIAANYLETPWPAVGELVGASPQVSANLAITPEGAIFDEGRITGQGIPPVHFMGQVGGDPLASFEIRAAYQDYAINGQIVYAPPELMIRGLDVKGNGLSAQASAGYNLEGGAIDLAASVALTGGAQAQLKAGGTAEQPTFSGRIESGPGISYQLSFGGTADLDDKTTITLRSLQGQVAGNDFSLASPVTISPQDGVRIDEARVNFEGGLLTFSGGHEEGGQIDVSLRGQDLPTDLGIAPMTLNGRMDLRASLSGPVENLTGEARVDLRRLTLPAVDGAGEQAISGTLAADYAPGRLAVNAELRGPENAALTAQATVPLSLVPFNLPDDAPVQGRLQADLQLGLVTLLAGLDKHRLRGNADLDLSLGGTLATPVVSGTGTITDGRYENITTGTEIQDLNASLSAQGGTIRLENFQGRGPGGGTIAGQGQVDMQDAGSPTFTLSATLDNLQLLSTDQLGVISSGEVQVAGDASGASVGGALTIDQAEYYIRRLGGTTGFGGFTIVETGGEEGGVAVTQQEAESYPVRLDLTVQADDGIFIRGPEIDTEWAADLTVEGTAEDPRIRGDLSVVRGTLQLIDTPIALNEGEILFNNPRISNPTLNLTGTMRGADLDATVKVTGEARAPEISLSSDPPLPEDEILSRVLFGTSMQDLTPVQGLKIAQTVAALSGRGGGGLDPLGRVRQAIGLDALSVGYDEEQGATLSVGKYVSDDLYIAVDQGVTPGSSAVRLEIDVTEDIEVETRLGSTNESSVGVNWKRDY